MMGGRTPPDGLGDSLSSGRVGSRIGRAKRGAGRTGWFRRYRHRTWCRALKTHKRLGICLGTGASCLDTGASGWRRKCLGNDGGDGGPALGANSRARKVKVRGVAWGLVEGGIGAGLAPDSKGGVIVCADSCRDVPRELGEALGWRSKRRQWPIELAIALCLGRLLRVGHGAPWQSGVQATETAMLSRFAVLGLRDFRNLRRSSRDPTWARLSALTSPRLTSHDPPISAILLASVLAHRSRIEGQAPKQPSSASWRDVLMLIISALSAHFCWC